MTQDRSSRQGEKLGDKIAHVADTASTKITDTLNSAGEAAGSIQEVTGNLGNAVQKSAHDQPMASLAVAAAVGFILGALWKS